MRCEEKVTGSYIHVGVISRDMLARKDGKGGAIARCEGSRVGGEEGRRVGGREGG